MSKALESYLKAKKSVIDRALKRYMPPEKEYPSSIHNAMRYVIFPGGKRIRAILCLAAYELFRRDTKKVLPAACAIELIHNFSLVHDDLPAIDDDDYRRGRLSCHRRFGEALGILCGDALLALAFEVISQNIEDGVQREVTYELTRAMGRYGMIGGQAADIELSKEKRGLPQLEYISSHKTGKLITASLKTGAIIGGADKAKSERIVRFGEYIGMVFQITDDIMDKDGYAELFGLKGAKAEAERFCELAKAELSSFGVKARRLKELSDFILKRKS